jgi:hypothetical protein
LMSSSSLSIMGKVFFTSTPTVSFFDACSAMKSRLWLVFDHFLLLYSVVCVPIILKPCTLSSAFTSPSRWVPRALPMVGAEYLSISLQVDFMCASSLGLC